MAPRTPWSKQIQRGCAAGGSGGGNGSDGSATPSEASPGIAAAAGTITAPAAAPIDTSSAGAGGLPGLAVRPLTHSPSVPGVVAITPKSMQHEWWRHSCICPRRSLPPRCPAPRASAGAACRHRRCAGWRRWGVEPSEASRRRAPTQGRTGSGAQYCRARGLRTSRHLAPLQRVLSRARTHVVQGSVLWFGTFPTSRWQPVVWCNTHTEWRCALQAYVHL